MYIGIDVGGTNLVAGLVDENGKILHKASCPVDKSMTAEELTRQLAKLSLQAAKEADCPLSEIQAAGVGLPGLVSNKTGMVIKTTNMPFYNTPSTWATTPTVPRWASTGQALPRALTLLWSSLWVPVSAAVWSGVESSTSATAAPAWRRAT